jgi:hypothetical protein
MTGCFLHNQRKVFPGVILQNRGWKSPDWIVDEGKVKMIPREQNFLENDFSGIA